MGEKWKKYIRPAVFLTGGALTGFLYYRYFGCQQGCAITSSPWTSMIYMGLVGWLLSGVFAPGKKKG